MKRAINIIIATTLMALAGCGEPMSVLEERALYGDERERSAAYIKLMELCYDDHSQPDCDAMMRVLNKRINKARRKDIINRTLHPDGL